MQINQTDHVVFNYTRIEFNNQFSSEYIIMEYIEYTRSSSGNARNLKSTTIARA